MNGIIAVVPNVQSSLGNRETVKVRFCSSRIAKCALKVQ